MPNKITILQMTKELLRENLTEVIKTEREMGGGIATVEVVWRKNGAKWRFF